MPKSSEHIVYHKDGSVWGKGKTVDGKPDGYWEWFRKDGTKMRSGHFKSGKNVGEWITFANDGRVVKKTMKKP
jgi:antitoxin component YwqK of YwqJK toxin-antitoxin module